MSACKANALLQRCTAICMHSSLARGCTKGWLLQQSSRS